MSRILYYQSKKCLTMTGTIFNKTLYFMFKFLSLILACCLWLLPAAAFAVPAPPLSFSNAELARKDFSGQKLQKAEFSNANLESTNFSGADMIGVVLSTSSLVNTNLHGANLTQALIDQVKFNGTDLSDAILVDSIMLRSRFKNVNIKGADFTGALLGKEQVLQLCKQADGVNTKTGADTRDSLGCK
jgi:uncharacterized protein YjbI with pentapeptide repeats